MMCTTTVIDLESSLAFLLDAHVREILFYFETPVCIMQLKHSVPVLMFSLVPGCLSSCFWSCGLLTSLNSSEKSVDIGGAPISVIFASLYIHE